MRLFALVSLSFALIASGAVAEPLEPLPAAEKAALAAIEADPLPKELSASSHFLVSDEKRHDLYVPSIGGVRGALVGVGTDQVYLLAGWADAEIVIPMDFDQMVVDLHRVYGLLFVAAETPAEFLALTQKAAAERVEELIAASSLGERDRKAASRAFRVARALVQRKLAATVALHETLGVRSFVNDQGQYDRVRALWVSGRVFPVRGDLTAKATMTQIGATLTRLGVPVRVLYLSNAEKYFKYTAQFEANVLGLPFDERTQVLRTQGRGAGNGVDLDGFYVYEVQAGRDFRAWLEGKGPWNVHGMRTVRAKTATPGLYTIGGPPPRR